MEGVEQWIPKDAETTLVFFVNGKKVKIYCFFLIFNATLTCDYVTSVSIKIIRPNKPKVHVSLALRPISV